MRKIDPLLPRSAPSEKVFRIEMYGMALVAIAWLLFGCTKQNNMGAPDQVHPAPPAGGASNGAPPASITPAVEEAILKHHLYTYPELTVLLAVKDAQRTAALVKAAGGSVTYDPNLSMGHDIGFLIAELPPEKITNKDFVKSLNLKAISVDHPRIRQIRPADRAVEASAIPKEEDLYVPIQDIKVDKLRKRKGNTHGEDVLVAVIDTGVDASHIAFGDRVVYWSDLTREGRVEVKATAPLSASEIKVGTEKWKIPETLDLEETLYVGVFNEAAMGSQTGDAEKLAGENGFDVNNNTLHDDQFAFIVGTAKDEAATLIAYVDSNGNKTLDAAEVQRPVMDFNRARAYTRKTSTLLKEPLVRAAKPAGAALLKFPSRSSEQSYPLIFTKDAEGHLKTVALGADRGSHGTHVAGIIAGDDGRLIKGAAPKAEIMSLKVCSGITCTEAAILRGLVDAFYNSEGLIPDVVNISLGSHEAYQQDPFNFLIRDLSAKFGTTFFISASNDGPGYRSLNAIGSFGPSVLVGAHVSKRTLTKHYTLNPGLEVPDQSLLFFTSLGPSYTGQLRPNIVAPGSALSSVPMTRGRSATYHGTSMSSPIAAGAAAALLGLAKTPNGAGDIADEVFRKLQLKRLTKVRAVLNKEAPEKQYSNIDIPLALRTSLEQSATAMPEYTLAQRGHGLINIDAAFDTYRGIVSEINSGKLHFHDFQINDNKKGLYDRATQVAKSKQILLALEEDGEAVDETYDILNKALTVQLERVEVQAADGAVSSILPLNAQAIASLPFSIAIRGVEGQTKATNVQVVMNDGFKNYFMSVRYPELMEAGKTYTAHYTVSRDGQRLFSLLDVVHKPLHFSNAATIVDLPSLDVNKANKVAVIPFQHQSIKANSFHRYPVAVTPQDGILKVQVGFSAQESLSAAGGFVYLTVYDPDGKQVGEGTAMRSNQLPNETRVGKLIVPTHKKPGIYEVTIAAAGSRWNGPTHYDLLIESLRFKASVDRVEIATEISESALRPKSKVISFSNPSQQARNITARVSSMVRMVSLAPLKVVPNRWTFKRLDVPPLSEDKGKETTRVEVQFGLGYDKEMGFVGRIDHRLYHLKDGKTPELAYTADKDESKEEKKVFLDVKRPAESGNPADALYVAVESFSTIAESAPVDKLIESLDVEALFPEIVPQLEGQLAIAMMPFSSDSFMITVGAPKEIKGTPRNKQAPKAQVRAMLQVNSDYADLSAQIPVTIYQ